MATLDDAKGVVEGLTFNIEKHRFIGSAFINGEGKDVDILIQIGEHADLDDRAYDLKYRGWTINAANDDYPSAAGWFAARKGLVNLLVTTDPEFYWAMGKAADVCKNLVAVGRLQPDDKSARVIIHRTLTGEAL
jgi:hypothetical protein